MNGDAENLQYNHFIDLLSEIILKYHQQLEKGVKEKSTAEKVLNKDSKR
jgi:hypothetical protein